jgi:hypothetical protein
VPYSGIKMQLKCVMLIQSKVFAVVVNGQTTHKLELHDLIHTTNGKIEAKFLVSCV